MAGTLGPVGAAHRARTAHSMEAGLPKAKEKESDRRLLKVDQMDGVVLHLSAC